MAYDSTGFTTVAASKAGNAPSIYTYATTDAIADVNTEGYFNSIASILKVGDLMYCVPLLAQPLLLLWQLFVPILVL